MLYRVTGKAARERIPPLLQDLHPQIDWVECKSPEESPTLVYETTCERTWNACHQRALILNRLHNSQILENKANLAVLQTAMDIPMLETYLAHGHDEVDRWCRWRFQKTSSVEDLDWWVLKASKGNGGRDVWIICKDNFEKILPEIPPNDNYVIQKYVQNPQLWHNRKFHLRCYTVLFGDMSAYVYEQAFILTASEPYDHLNCDEVMKHITNLAVNKNSPQHPGQISISLCTHFPLEFIRIKKIWQELIQAAAPFICHQASIAHFEFFGIDIIADVDHNCWLLECNRLPGLKSSVNNLEEEDNFYSSMILSLIKLSLQHASSKLHFEGCVEHDHPGWTQVCKDYKFTVNPQSEPHMNLINWFIFSRKRLAMLRAYNTIV